MTTTPLLTLNNGVQMAAIGLGVFQSSPEDTVTAVESAIAQGYRLIDTAASYFNERQVGEGIRRSGVSRDDIFIETKVWISDYGYEATLHAFDKSAGKLGVDRLDLLLLHQPLPSRFDLTLGAYRALEKLLADGRVRAIGVSNFMPDHLARLLAAVTVVPAVNQIEVHPYFQQTACSACTPSTASSRRPGRRSGASRRIAEARSARSTIRRWERSRGGMASRRLR